jgi:hypothetical protein
VSGQGFRPGSRVKIVFEAPRRVVVGSVVASPQGHFDASVVVPRARPGNHRFEVLGTSASGRPATLATPVMVLASVDKLPTKTDYTTPALVAIAVGIPLMTWLALGLLSTRRRRGRRAGA